MRKSAIVLSFVLSVVLSGMGYAKTGKILLGGNWNLDTQLSFQVVNPNSSGIITINNVEFFYPDGTNASLKSPFPLPQTLNPREVRAYDMINFLDPVPPQQPWHPETYTIVIHWEGDVVNDLIAVSQTAVYEGGKLITIIINQFENKSLQ